MRKQNYSVEKLVALANAVHNKRDFQNVVNNKYELTWDMAGTIWNFIKEEKWDMLTELLKNYKCKMKEEKEYLERIAQELNITR